MADADPASLAELKSSGYLHLKNFYPKNYVDFLRNVSQRHYHDVLAAGTKPYKSLGAMLSLWEREEFAQAMTDERHRDLFSQWGFLHPRFSGGYHLTKPPHSPPTAWHQDWWGWQDPRSYTPFIHQIGFLIYLQDTHPENGCLRALPGSHRKYLPLHAELTNSDCVTLREYQDPTHIAYQPQPYEINLEARAGDLIVIDARMLHATHPNTSDQDRSMIVLWYFPDTESLEKSIYEAHAPLEVPATWHQNIRSKLETWLGQPNRTRSKIQPLLHPCASLFANTIGTHSPHR